MVKRAWLSVTPEPERELPLAVATLRSERRPKPAAVAVEQARIERLVLRGAQRQWIDYLRKVVELIDRHEATEDADVQLARVRAIEVIANHHNLLLGLPGPGAMWTSADRAHLGMLLSNGRQTPEASSTGGGHEHH